MIFIETERLILREWKPEDLAPFAAINQDPKVMECFPNLLTEAQTAAMVEKIKHNMKRDGFSLFACEVKKTGKFIGFVGLSIPDFEAAFTPCVEIGWRLASDAWGHGYATEAAQAVLKFGFIDKGLEEIVSFTVPDNQRSQNVMKKIGMTRDFRSDFRHPKLPQDHPLSLHVLYRLQRKDWLKFQ